MIVNATITDAYDFDNAFYDIEVKTPQGATHDVSRILEGKVKLKKEYYKMSNVSVTITEENNTVTISQPGPVGPQGAGITTYTDTTDDNVDPGHVIYKKGNGNVAKLVANGSVVPRVAGIVITGSVQSGGAQYRMEGLVDIADWSAFTDEGNAGLSEGNFIMFPLVTQGR